MTRHSTLADLDGLDDLSAELCRRARERGVRLIWRAQSRASRSVVVREGKAESTSVSTVAGHGLQVVTDRGHTSLGCRDDFRAAEALDLLERTVAAAAAGPALGLSPGAFEGLEPVRAREVPADLTEVESLDLGVATSRLAELERELEARAPGVTLQLSVRAEVEAWRIARDDGTDVTFAIPRANVGARATTAGDGARHGVAASLFHPDPRLLEREEVVGALLRRAGRAAELARALPDAPAFPAGSYPLVIDYGLAKGLAHEAFGHAAEADGFRSSILAHDGRFKCGDRVGAEHVSIVDEPVPADHAWQPFSANGVRRDRAVIVDHGRLGDGLSDPWSAAAGGVRLTGAARAESFRNAPQPRMTNIRIEVDAPLPATGAFEDYGPEEVRALLADAGVLRRHPRVIFLSGYSGGQVNTATGDFVFNCKAIYALDARGVELFKPAIFSGSMFGALESLREAFGPLRLDAIGYCGKWGQSVPSSGGSHYFLFLEPHPAVRLGGR